MMTLWRFWKIPRMKRWLRIYQVTNIKRWRQLQLLLIPLPTRSSIAVFLILHFISTLFHYLYTDCYYFHNAFLKQSDVWKNRILAGLIHFSRLKMVFFKKVAFLPTQNIHESLGHSLAMYWSPGAWPFNSCPIWAMTQKVQQNIIATSPTIDPSIPFNSRSFWRCMDPAIMRGIPNNDITPHKRQFSPRASAFLPNW